MISADEARALVETALNEDLDGILSLIQEKAEAGEVSAEIEIEDTTTGYKILRLLDAKGFFVTYDTAIKLLQVKW